MVNVVVCSADPVVSELLTLNLNQRGFVVRQAYWSPCCGSAETMPEFGGAAVIIADLDCPTPACWTGAARLRGAGGSLPILFLGHERPGAAWIRRLRPCSYLHNPFALPALLELLHRLTPAATEEQAAWSCELGGRSPSGRCR